MATLSDLQRLGALDLTQHEGIVSLAPPEVQEICRVGPESCRWAAQQLVQAAGQIMELTNQLRDLNAALDIYARQGAGMDPMFRQNLELCKRQVRR